MIIDYVDLDAQLQSSGFDLSLESVEEYLGGGVVDFYDKERVVGKTRLLTPDESGGYTLDIGVN